MGHVGLEPCGHLGTSERTIILAMSSHSDKPEHASLEHWARYNAGRVASEPLLLPLHQLLNKHDPMKLIAVGAPEDEYDQELFDIARRLHDCSSADDMVGMVHAVFCSWFDAVAGPREAYRSLGQDIWALWHSTRLQGQQEGT